MTPRHEIEARLRETAEQLLREKKVDIFLGYEKAAMPFRTAPVFITSPEEAGRLVWNPFCTTNLAVYLPGLFMPPANARQAKDLQHPAVGIVLKGCETRSVAVLVQERQVPREKLVLVGVACGGVVDRQKAEAALGSQDAIDATEDADGNVTAVVDGASQVALARDDVFAAACLECRAPTPALYDVLLGDPIDSQTAEVTRARTAEFQSRALDERWAHLTESLADCIRCNACRQACPMCYCRECLLDQGDPRWIGAGTDPSDVVIYHLVRAFHLAGRCTECGACTRACPMGIDTRLLIRKLNQDVEDLYGYTPGEAIDATPPLSAFAMDDPQDFLTEP